MQKLLLLLREIPLILLEEVEHLELLRSEVERRRSLFCLRLGLGSCLAPFGRRVVGAVTTTVSTHFVGERR
jgi:hypothetical protein